MIRGILKFLAHEHKTCHKSQQHILFRIQISCETCPHTNRVYNIMNMITKLLNSVATSAILLLLSQELTISCEISLKLVSPITFRLTFNNFPCRRLCKQIKFNTLALKSQSISHHSANPPKETIKKRLLVHRSFSEGGLGDLQ